MYGLGADGDDSNGNRRRRRYPDLHKRSSSCHESPWGMEENISLNSAVSNAERFSLRHPGRDLAIAVRGVFGAKGWRIAFLAGLVLPAALLGLGTIDFPQGLPMLAVSGLLVGLGTRLGSGCTSGHGVCGLANLSPRSLVATSSFMIVAAATVFLVRHGALLWHS